MQTAARLILSGVLTLVFSMLCFAQQVETLYDFEESGLYYKIVSESEVEISPISKTITGGIITYEGINTVYDLHVPGTIVYNDSFYKVIGIADHAFENSTSLEGVKIDYMSSFNNPITIGESAFENCDNLTCVAITQGVNEIGTRAFYDCDRLNKIALGAAGVMFETNMTVKQDAFASNPSLKYIFLTASNPEFYTFENCFEGNSPDMIMFVPNSNFEYEGALSSFNKMQYGSFEKCNVPYTGEVPQITPIFKSNMPAGFTINQPYFESYERNAGSYSSSAWVSFIAGYPDYMEFGINIPFEYTITPAPLTISTGNYERAYGEPNPDITINVTGYLNGDDESIFVAKPQIVNGIGDWAPLPDTTSDAGVYNIDVMATLPWGSNYECQYEIGTLTVIPADQVISWDLDKLDFYKGEIIELNALSSSGLPVEYSSSDPDIAKIENGTLLFLEEGHATISASQPGNKNYNAAESISHTFVVTAKPTEELTLNISNAELEAQEQLQLVISDYEWTSSDEKVAKVSESGLVTAIDAGTATITLSRKNDGTTLAVCMIKVDKTTSISERSLKKELQVKCEGTELKIEGASPSSIVKIFDINGRNIYSGTDRIIPLSQGIFIVSIEDCRFKIILK